MQRPIDSYAELRSAYRAAQHVLQSELSGRDLAARWGWVLGLNWHTAPRYAHLPHPQTQLAQDLCALAVWERAILQAMQQHGVSRATVLHNFPVPSREQVLQSFIEAADAAQRWLDHIADTPNVVWQSPTLANELRAVQRAQSTQLVRRANDACLYFWQLTAREVGALLFVVGTTYAVPLSYKQRVAWALGLARKGVAFEDVRWLSTRLPSVAYAQCLESRWTESKMEEALNA